MASYTVTNTAGLLSAGSDADSIYVQSGALQASTILGQAGNDTINLEEDVVNASAAAFSVHGGAGDDSIYIASAHFSAGGGYSLLGGGGNDTLNLAGSGELASKVKVLTQSASSAVELPRHRHVPGFGHVADLSRGRRSGNGQWT